MAIIQFDDVSKRYRLGGAHQSLLSNTRKLAKRLMRAGSPEDDTLWALRNVNFAIEPGEMVGIIGRNGAGKSTMLKLLSQVAYPTTGKVECNGRLSAMIELGAGFHPDLSGRDNIFLSGAIQGLRRREIERLVDPIIEFAELRKFIETPVKYYSSGMYARLGFAIVQQIDSEILLIDEVLSVGDAAFRRKCLDRMREMHDQGRTIILVSHDTWSITSFCTRAIMMDKGRIEADGTASDVVAHYRQFERDEWLEHHHDDERPSGTGDVRIEDFEFLDETGAQAAELTQKDITIRVHYLTNKVIDNPVFILRIRRMDGLVCCNVNSTRVPEMAIDAIAGRGFVEAKFPFLPLVPDNYTVEAVIQHRDLPLVYAREISDNFRIKGIIGNSELNGVFNTRSIWAVSEPTKAMSE